MERSEERIDLSRRLANRLYPLTLLIWLLISFGYPAIYYILEVTALKETATIYAQEFSDKLQDLVIEDPSLWKYQNHKYNQIFRNLLPQKQVATVSVLDERGQAIADYEQKIEKAEAWCNRYAPVGPAPIIFKNHKIGMVQVRMSQVALLEMTGGFFVISTIAGTGLAGLVYFFPVTVVTKMEGQIRHLIQTLQLSKRKSDRLRAAAQASEQRSHELIEQLKQFAADASHELRNPLTVINNTIEVMQSHPERIHPLNTKKLVAIASATNQMIRLAEDLLLLTRIDAVVAPVVEHTSVPLNRVVQDVVEFLEPQAQARGIIMSYSLVSTFVNGDAAQLTRMFSNLLENALKYTTAGGSVAVSMDRSNLFVVVNIEDTGMGIAPEHLPFIFQRFWRADRARSRQIEGSGLGLAIAQAIAQQHGGEIIVSSQVGVGSCFAVYLPMA